MPGDHPSDDDAPLAAYITLSIICLGIGTIVEYQTWAIRKLPAEEFQKQLEERTQSNIERLKKKREDALAKATELMKQCEEKVKTAKQQCENGESKIRDIDRKRSELSQRLQSLTGDMLRGKVDPLMQRIIES